MLAPVCQSVFIFLQPSAISSQSFLHPNRFSIDLTKHIPVIPAAMLTSSTINFTSLYVMSANLSIWYPVINRKATLPGVAVWCSESP